MYLAVLKWATFMGNKDMRESVCDRNLIELFFGWEKQNTILHFSEALLAGEWKQDVNYVKFWLYFVFFLRTACDNPFVNHVQGL